MNIIIDKVEEKRAKNDALYKLIKAGEEAFACFDTALFPLLVPGAVVEVEVKKKGNFSNITAVKAQPAQPVVQPAPASAPTPAPTAPTASARLYKSAADMQMERASIEGQVALKEIGALLREKPEMVPEMLKAGYLTALEKLINRLGGSPALPTVAKPAPVKPARHLATSPTNDEVETDQGQSGPSKASRKETKGYPQCVNAEGSCAMRTEPGDFDCALNPAVCGFYTKQTTQEMADGLFGEPEYPVNAGELFSWARDKFAIDYRDALKILGIKKPGDIPDVRTAWDTLSKSQRQVAMKGEM